MAIITFVARVSDGMLLVRTRFPPYYCSRTHTHLLLCVCVFDAPAECTASGQDPRGDMVD